LWGTECIQVQAALGFGALDAGALDIDGLELLGSAADHDVVFVDKVAIFVIEHRHLEGTLVELAANPGFDAFAGLRLEIRIGFDGVAQVQVFKAAVQRFGGRCAETFGVLAEPGVLVRQRVGQAKLGRHAVPGFLLVAHRFRTCRVDGVEEFLGQLGFELGVVIAHGGEEGPFVPSDLVLCEQRIGVDGRVGEVAGLLHAIGGHRAGRADGGATAADGHAGRAALARAGDFLLLKGGAVGHLVIGFTEAERFVQLCIENPLFFLVERVACAQDATTGLIDFGGGLVGLGDLVIDAGLDAVGNRRLKGEAVFQAETFTGDGVVTTTITVEVEASAADERAAHRVLQVDVAIILVLLVRQTQAVVIAIVPAELRQDVSGARFFRVGACAIQAGGVVAVVGLSFVTVALAQVQQTVEVLNAAGEGARGQPTFVGGAVAGLQAGAEVLAWLDDVNRVEGEVTDGAADGAAAVEGRRRPAQDFHALYDFRVDVVAAGLGVGAVEEVARHFHTVHLSKDTVAIDAANVEAGITCSCTSAAHRDAGLVAHQFPDVVDVLAVQFLTLMHADGTRHAVHILRVTGCADGHLLQVEGAARCALFQHDVVIAQFAVAQVGPHQQPVQRFFWRQRAACARRRHALAQLCGQADLPAGHGGKGIERRDQRLLFDAEGVVALAARNRFGSGGGHGRRAGQQDGGSQQGQDGRRRPAVETRGHRKRSGGRIL